MLDTVSRFCLRNDLSVILKVPTNLPSQVVIRQDSPPGDSHTLADHDRRIVRFISACTRGEAGGVVGHSWRHVDAEGALEGRAFVAHVTSRGLASNIKLAEKELTLVGRTGYSLRVLKVTVHRRAEVVHCAGIDTAHCLVGAEIGILVEPGGCDLELSKGDARGGHLQSVFDGTPGRHTSAIKATLHSLIQCPRSGQGWTSDILIRPGACGDDIRSFSTFLNDQVNAILRACLLPQHTDGSVGQCHSIQGVDPLIRSYCCVCRLACEGHR